MHLTGDIIAHILKVRLGSFGVKKLFKIQSSEIH